MFLDVQSAVPHINWLAIPNSRASQMLAMQFQLELSQWLSPAEILQRQAIQIAILCRHAYATVPYYRQRFDAAGMVPDDIRNVKDWLHVPILLRGDIQVAGASLHCPSGPKEHGEILTSVTSGSSGRPITTLSTTVTRLFYNALLLRYHIWHARDFRLTLAGIRSFPGLKPREEVVFDNWGPGTTDVVRTGPTYGLDVHAGTEAHAEFLLKHDPAYLNTYPSIAIELARYFIKSDRRLTRLREIRTFGEVLDPQVRTACRDVWEVPVVDSYSSQEVGHIALQCPEHEHYHIQSESLLVEVLDDAGRPCTPGQVGRVVITALNNFAMPLIRYEIGDFAEVGAPCPCGRGLPVLTKIVGRQRNMFLLPDGRRVWPALEITESERAHLPPIQQFQVIQRTSDSVELLAVAPRLFTREEEMILRDWIERSVGYPMRVTISHVEDISRGPTGKYEDFRSDLV